MLRRWILPAVATIARLPGSMSSELLTRSVRVQRTPTVADVLPVPVAVVTTDDVRFAVPAGAKIVTTADPEAERVGRYLADLIGGSAPEPGQERPPQGIALLIKPAWDDEQYSLEVAADGVTIRAGGAAGLFWGVQTLRQLAPASGPMVLPGVRVSDRPRFRYRGVMLDVARHFFDVAAVQRLIDLASMYKINYLHLHLTDDQGWRIASDTWPRLVSVGATTEVGGGDGGYYTREDYRQIVEYARARFMTVVPEIDVPGHTNAALVAYPELAYPKITPRPYTGTWVGFSALCPGREPTSRFLTDVLGEIAAMTPGPYLHIGGDEALTMSDRDYAAIVTQAQEIVVEHGKTPVGWHELAGAALSPTTVLQFWGTTPWMPDVVAAAKAGAQLIMSPADRTYLDQRHSWRDRPPGARSIAAEPAERGADARRRTKEIGRTWAGPVSAERAYDWDPVTYLPDVPESAVLGVEAPLWTEGVSTMDDVEYLTFPRLAAIAEIGWSPRSTHDWSAFRHRLGAQAPRWEALGVNFARVAGVPWVAPETTTPAHLPRQRGGNAEGSPASREPTAPGQSAP